MPCNGGYHGSDMWSAYHDNVALDDAHHKIYSACLQT